MIALILITNSSSIAQYAISAGVDRIMVDLEHLGKRERQRGRDTHVADHCIDDVFRVRGCVPPGALIVRANPIHGESDCEIEAIIEAGADMVMLPMFRTVDEVATFIRLVDRRAAVSLLLETPQALVRLPYILEVDGIDELHVGLNDLHLGLGLTFMFELLAGGIVEYIAYRVRAEGIRFGFGGVARVGQGELLAEAIIGEHVRLGSECVILSRSFHGGARTVEELAEGVDLALEVRKLRECEASFANAEHETLVRNSRVVRAKVAQLVDPPSMPTEHA